jgi:N-acylneuraminate cytidylyltransferase
VAEGQERVVAIIPARGGSKGIPRKNLIDFCGRPLLAWSILQASLAQGVDEVFVTSNDEEILGVAREYGATPILRPAELATDTATSEAALEHALTVIEQERKGPVDLVVFLQATSPLREPSDIDGAIRTLRAEGADSLFSMALLDDFCMWTRTGGELKGLGFDPWNRGRRQDREPILLENGSIYVFKPEVLRTVGNRLGGKLAVHEMAFWKSYEIDEIHQVELCRYYFERHNLARAVGLPAAPEVPGGLKLLVYDFDGVMTDNKVLIREDGLESVAANRGDGLGVGMLKKLGYRQMILSTEENRVVATRAAKLGLEVIHGCREKRQALEVFCSEQGIALESVLFVGNDVNDLEVMRAVGFSVAPADAHEDILAIAHLTTRAAGGQGVIRELADYLGRNGR